MHYAIITHWHWDHGDGDGWGRAAGATLIADKLAVQRFTQTIRVAEWGHSFSPVLTKDLPNSVLTGDKLLRFDGETVRIRHYRPGHTDGDLSALFEKAGILQTGDTFWNGMYPFIDYVSGGSIDGAIAAANANIAMVGARTVVIPGHGPVGDRTALVAFRDMLVSVRARVSSLKSQGRSVIDGKLFTALVYRGV